MPKVSEIYTGAYLNAAELVPLGQRRRAVVHGATVEEIGQEKGTKVVLALVSAKGLPWPKEVVLNKGNALQMAAAFGDDTDAWIGKQIELWAENVMFQGRMVPGIKVQPVFSGSTAGAGSVVPLPAPASAHTTPAPAQGGPQQQQWDTPAADLDDGNSVLSANRGGLVRW